MGEKPIGEYTLYNDWRSDFPHGHCSQKVVVNSVVELYYRVSFKHTRFGRAVLQTPF